MQIHRPRPHHGPHLTRGPCRGWFQLRRPSPKTEGPLSPFEAIWVRGFGLRIRARRSRPHAESEIADLGHLLGGEEDVGELKIPVPEPSAVDVSQAVRDALRGSSGLHF